MGIIYSVLVVPIEGDGTVADGADAFHGCDSACPDASLDTEFPYEDVCGICLECIVTPLDLAITNCCHQYHAPCLRLWLSRSCTCPTCRAQLEFHLEF